MDFCFSSQIEAETRATFVKGFVRRAEAEQRFIYWSEIWQNLFLYKLTV